MKELSNRILAGIFVVLVIGLFGFYVKTTSMIEVYKTDQMYATKDRMVLIKAVNNLNKITNAILVDMAVNNQRITTLEQKTCMKCK